MKLLVRRGATITTQIADAEDLNKVIKVSKTYPFINEAKRASRGLQKTGYKWEASL